jgi:DNA-binding transcriptional ArsR family regulator
MGTESKGKPADLFEGLAHPLRRRVLRLTMDERREVTPRELSDRLEEPLSVLSYHVRVLEQCNAVRLTRTERVRGATQHFYRFSLRADWAKRALEKTKDPPKVEKEKGRRGGEKGGRRP